MRTAMLRLAAAGVAFLFLSLPVAAQRFDSLYPSPLTSYTLYATGSSLTSPVSLGQRSSVPASMGGFVLLRLVSPLSFFFLVAPSAPGGIAANLSSFFLPANTVGFFRVPWGHWLAVITPTVLNSENGRAIIYVTEME